MPIYDQSYRPYQGTLSNHSMRWMTIAKAGLSHYLSRKLFLVFLFVGFIPAIARGVIIWLTHQSAAGREVDIIDGAWFRNFLDWQGMFLLLVCIWPGAVLIARDLKTNAIQLYLSKPLTRLDYVAGKFAVLAGIAALLMPAPALLLFLMETGLSTDTTFVATYFWLPFAIIGYSLVVIVGAGLLALAASSFTRSGRYAGLLFFAIVFFSQAGGQLMRFITGNHSWIVLSLPALMDQTGAIFFGGPTEFGVHPLPALGMYALLIGLSLVVLRRRVQAVEIVT